MKDRRGFTLIEIIIVIAIVGIVAVIATTNLSLWQGHYSVVGFQREFLSQIGEARTRSVASSRQHRLLIDQGAETVTFQRGNAGNGSTAWANVGRPVVGSRGAGIDNVVCTPSVALPSSFALVFNADGGVLLQPDPANAATSPLTEANIRISATNAADRSTIRLFGWTSKARLENGWL